jgi:gliding motility-associated lipoprotein GldH
MAKISVFLFTLMLLFSSCGKNSLYSKSVSFPSGKWNVSTVPVFKINIPDTVKAYTLELTLRVSTDYNYSNLWLFFNSSTPKGEKGREPIEIKIANPDGSWAGEKSGTLVETKVAFKNRRFPQKGWYTFSLEQGITEKTIDHIQDISLTLNEASHEN